MSARRNLVFGGVLVAALAALVAYGVSRRGNGAPSKYTIGDIRSVHAEVTVGAREIRGAARIADGDTVVTGPDGRARVRLDDGTLVVVDASTTLALHGTKLVLAEGRLFVQGSTASRSEVTLGDAVTTVSASAAAFERRRAQAPDRIYCAQGELVVASGGHQERVASGETATLDPSGPKVAPEAAFDDWTGGLAVPWTGEAGQASAVPEISDGTTPLVVRQAKIDVTLHGEVASTRTRVRYWNGGDHDVTGAISLTVPPGAILARVARGNEQGPDVDALVLPGDRWKTGGAAVGRLEWAGGSTLRGQLPGIAAGQTVDLVVEYVEWLSIRNGRATYRFPLASGGDPPLVSDLVFSADAAKAGSPWVSASAGTTIDGQTVATHRADARPTGDLVVELSPNVVHAGAARAYVTPGEAGEDPYVLVRTEAPEATDTSVSLALVVDTSSSVGASALEMERSVVDAVMEGLGPRDGLVVFAADQTVRPIGPATPGPVTPDRRAAIRRELASVRAFGASNLGAALEVAADTLDAARPGGGMVVYLGDGRPTMGEPDARALRKRLARRASGMPRVGAVAVTAASDRFLLARLVAGVGPVYEVGDRAEAARVGAALLADALEPTLRDVDLDLGSTIDRIYPREAHVSLSGSTVTVVGRLRGRLPDHIGFRFRRGMELVQESRRLESVSAPPFADVPKRWAAARIEEMSARGDGLEPAIALATRAKLLTPWTGFYFAGTGETAPQPSLPFPSRVFGLSPALDAPFAAHVAKTEPVPSVLIEPRATFGGGVTLLEAAAASARRTIDGARRSIVACRDARAQVRPEIADALRIEVVVGKDGHATRVRVTPADRGGDDVVLDRCVEAVVSSLPFFDANAEVKVDHDVVLPRGRGTRQTVCSEVSRLPFVVRRTIWQGRLQQNTLDFVTAARACELPSWRDRRELLTLLLEGKKGPEALSLASSLEAAGEADAAAFVQKEAFRRVANVAELEALRSIVLRDEPDVDDEFERAYAAAKTDEARLAVVRRFLLVAPHGALVRRRLIALLEALGKRDALVQELERIRADPFADAGLLALGASALRRAGRDDDGRRAFGELVERAPGDPWTLAYVGDHLRAEGLFDDATAAYDTLAHLLPDDPAAILRLGLAHAGAGRLDVATRLLDRVAQTGGRGDDGSLGELASITEAVLIAGARRGSPGPDAEAELVRRLMQTPLPDVGSVVVVQSAPSDDPVEVRVARGDRGRDEDPADLDAASMGLSVVRIERGDGAAKIHLVRRADVGPTRLAKASVSVLVIGEDRAESKLITRDVDVAAGGTGVELSFDGVTLL